MKYINSYTRYLVSLLFISYCSTQIFIMYHELEHLKMCLGTVIDMNETFNIVTGEVLVDRSHGCAHDAAAGT